jgi:hypothetical protein
MNKSGVLRRPRLVNAKRHIKKRRLCAKTNMGVHTNGIFNGGAAGEQSDSNWSSEGGILAKDGIYGKCS